MVAAIIGGAYFFFGQKTTLSRQGTELLDPGAYMENANSLRGNNYVLEGTVRNSLAWDPSIGRLISIEVSGTPARQLPVMLPASLNKHNIQQGQRILLRVKVEGNGLLVASSIDKS